MYLAKKNDNGNLPMYKSLFQRLADGETVESLSEIEAVLIDTKHIAAGEKDIYSARNDYFYLVSYLLSNGKEFLKNLDESSIGNSTYRQIADLLNKETNPA